MYNSITIERAFTIGLLAYDGKFSYSTGSQPFTNVSSYQLKRFLDKEWDGEPLEPEICSKCSQDPCVCKKVSPKPCIVCGMQPCQCEKTPPPDCPKCLQSPCVCNKKVVIKLADGKERLIKHMISTSFWGADGKPISVEEFLNKLYGALPSYFKDEAELREIWSNPITRKALLNKLADAGYGENELAELQKLVDAEKSDLFDVLEYISFNIQPMTREVRVAQTRTKILDGLSLAHKAFLEFVLFKYIDTGFEELDQSRLPNLIELKYSSMTDAADALGGVDAIRGLFFNFQKQLYGCEPMQT